jgi:acyl carrier protein
MTPESHEILSHVQEAIRRQLSFAPDAPVPPDADFHAQLGGDSLDLAELTMNLEEEFDINAPDGALPPPVTPAKIAALIGQCLAARSAPIARAPSQRI